MSLARYTTGLILCLVLTALSFGAVWLHYYNHHIWPTHPELFVWILALAVLQLIAQLIFFLHIGGRSRRDTLMFFFAIVLISILVGGSLWILTNLSGRTQTPSQDQMIQYMQQQDDAM